MLDRNTAIGTQVYLFISRHHYSCGSRRTNLGVRYERRYNVKVGQLLRAAVWNSHL